MRYYIRSAVLDQIFGLGEFENTREDYLQIVEEELVQEYETHLLPMMMYSCRTFITRLPHIAPNTDFLNFNRHTSPVPLPSADEISRPFHHAVHTFSGFGMPYRVESDILRIDDSDPSYFRETISPEKVHPESRSLVYLVRPDKFSSLTRHSMSFLFLRFRFTSQCRHG